jgi:hypothetical protein
MSLLLPTSLVAYMSTAAINTNSSRTQEYPPSGNGPLLSSPKIHIASAKPQVSDSTQAPLHQPPAATTLMALGLPN